jgi:predicted metal-dependent HD superfamily phosphohydrolase
MPPILEQTRAHVWDIFLKHPPKNLFYHSYQHTHEVASTCKNIAESLQLSETDKEILLIAAWFHDTGYLFTLHKHEDKSKQLAADFLNAQNYPHTPLVLNCIEATRLGSFAHTLLEQILADADMAYGVTDAYPTRSQLLRSEWAITQNLVYNNLDWEQSQTNFLSKVYFHTEYAQLHFQPILQLNLLRQTEAFQKAKEKAADKLKKKQKKEKLEQIEGYKKLESNPPVKAVQSFLRSVYPNHISLSAIADNKANMMISINSIVLTLIAAIFSLSAGSFNELRNSLFVIPILLFIITSLTSLSLAILSLIPRLPKNTPNLDTLYKQNIVFFGNFVQLSSDEYEKQMKIVLNDTDLLYGNMMRDLYQLGKVLKQKYAYISNSYKAFLIGFAVSVGAFLIVSLI